MSVTLDCGENKHDLCTGTGRQAYLVPQEDRWPPDPPFNCGCTCHHTRDAKVPCRQCQPLVGEETFGGVVLTEHIIGEPMPEDHPAWPRHEVWKAFDVSALGRGSPGPGDGRAAPAW